MTKMFVTKPEYKRRLKTCHSCENFNPDLHKCNLCKCFLHLKALLKTSSCPEEKWNVRNHD
jgi:hypothetical protein